MPESRPERPLKSIDPVRVRCTKQYWASVQKWAERRGLDKDTVHSELKEKLKFKHLAELKIQRLSDLAYEIGVIADGGAGL